MQLLWGKPGGGWFPGKGGETYGLVVVVLSARDPDHGFPFGRGNRHHSQNPYHTNILRLVKQNRLTPHKIRSPFP